MRSSLGASLPMAVEHDWPHAPPSRWDAIVTVSSAALLDGDESRAISLIRQALSVTSLTSVLDDMIAPCLRQIGARWEAGELSIWAEHRATATVSRILGEITPNPVGRRRGRAVVTSVAGDRHSVATEMAVAALREDSWRVHHLGSDIPGDEIVDFCRTEPVHIAVISVTVTSGDDLVGAVRRQLDGLGVDTIVGGPGRRLSELQMLARQARGSGPVARGPLVTWSPERDVATALDDVATTSGVVIGLRRAQQLAWSCARSAEPDSITPALVASRRPERGPAPEHRGGARPEPRRRVARHRHCSPTCSTTRAPMFANTRRGASRRDHLTARRWVA